MGSAGLDRGVGLGSGFGLWGAGLGSGLCLRAGLGAVGLDRGAGLGSVRPLETSRAAAAADTVIVPR